MPKGHVGLVVLDSKSELTHELAINEGFKRP